ncbi:MAG: hypothetical protein CBC82_06790 [Cellvibrionales bacterium TMED122]|nr:MAG: hypothetical protein CBC82_06790 [Cellvibrionales bacterium TMED122]
MKFVIDNSLKDFLLDVIKECMEYVLTLKTFKVESKFDGSPVTDADKKIDKIIQKNLSSRYPYIPVVSEEKDLNKGAFLTDRYWLIDPIDGTKSFAKNGTGYTINIAMIHQGNPILGFIAHPPSNTVWYGFKGKTFVLNNNVERQIQVSQYDVYNMRIVASQNYDLKTKEFLNKIKNIQIEHFSSSIKFCKLAEGKADLYARLNSISKWDIAAGDAILRSAGGITLNEQGAEIKYNTSSTETGIFFAVSSKTIWNELILSRLNGI